MSRQLPQPTTVPDAKLRGYLQQLVRELELRLVASPQTAGSGGGLTAEDVEDLVAGLLVAGDGINLVYNDGSGSLTVTNEDAVPYDTLVDDAGGGITYVGKAATGSAEASAVWRIYRLDESASPDVEIRYADGVSTFTKVWNNRATYTY